MPQLRTSKDFQPLQRLRFCYLCAQPILPDEPRNREHVPPHAVFLKEHRGPSLWLPAHVTCNSEKSGSDEKMGQLIDMLHGKTPSNHRFRRLALDEKVGGVRALNIEYEVARWIRGMHAALYEEPLADMARMILTIPFVKWVDGVGVTPLRPEHEQAVMLIKKNRAAGRLDCISMNSGKFIYECVWGKDADDLWVCAFAMNLYDWKDLGHLSHGPARGCAGFYYAADFSKPALATVETSLIIPHQNFDPLDPFGS